MDRRCAEGNRRAQGGHPPSRDRQHLLKRRQPSGAVEDATMTYKQPPLNRGVYPQKMNWLWRLVCEAGYITVDDVVTALRAKGVDVERRRAEGWLRSEGSDGYFPLSIAELEQNLRSILSMRAEGMQPGGTTSAE